MNIHQPGAALERFRAQTERQKPMAGVTSPPFVCKHCQQSRKVSGRKRVPMGWICRACNEVSA